MNMDQNKHHHEEEVIKICRNCAYYVQLSYPPCSCNWGDCQKSGNVVRDIDGRKTSGGLTWEDRQCTNFRPK
jgi:hypothetical protein